MMRGLLAENDIEVAVAASGGWRSAEPVRRGRALQPAGVAGAPRRGAGARRAPLQVAVGRGRRVRPHGGALRRAAAGGRRMVGAVRADRDGGTRRGDAAAGRRLRDGAARRRGRRAFGVRAWGVDRSRRWCRGTRGRARLRGSRSGWRLADALPFRDGWFDAVTMRLVVHALGDGRRNALREAARVLAPGGRVFIWTFAPSTSRASISAPYLPSLPAVDLARFPEPEVIAAELRGAGFDAVRAALLVQTGVIGRAEAAARVRAGYISTVHLLPEPRSPPAWRGSRPRRRGVRPICRRCSTGACSCPSPSPGPAPDSVQLAVGDERPHPPVPLRPRPESPERS